MLDLYNALNTVNSIENNKDKEWRDSIVSRDVVDSGLIPRIPYGTLSTGGVAHPKDLNTKQKLNEKRKCYNLIADKWHYKMLLQSRDIFKLSLGIS